MFEKYKNKYRIDSTRLKHWDYKWNAAYFITICTRDRKKYFGNVVNGKMILNEIGKISEDEWLKTFEIRPDMNLSMGEYVVMPNHFHAIIFIGENQYNSRLAALGNSPSHNTACSTDGMHCVSSNNSIDPADDLGESKNQFGPQSKNLASIIRGFKIGVTTRARIIDPNFAWQPRYHEHIIRDDKSFNNISNYIINNPLDWQKEKLL